MDWNVFDITKSIAIVAVVAMLWFYGGKLANHFTKPIPTPPSIVRIDENAVKLAAITASNEMAEKMRNEFAAEKSQILAAYEEQRKTTKETLDELGKVKLELGQTRDLLKRTSDHMYVNEKKPELTQDFKKIYTKDAAGEEFPIAWAMYYPFQTEDKRWKSGTYPVDFTLNVIESENPDGTFNRYAEAYMSNDQMKETKGRLYKLKITDIKWQKFERSDRNFFWWNPRIALGATFTNLDISPMLNLSLSSYGKTKSDMDWRFFTFGVGGTKDSNDWKGVFSVEPFSWNIGKALPLIENVFVGPVLTIDSESEYGGGVQVSVPF